jgi:hypothetical protein
VVIFSSSAESATYILPLAGVGIWYVLHPGNRAANVLLGAVLVITSLSSTDFFPHYLEDHWVRAYSLKVIPCLVVWFWLIYDLLMMDFQNFNLPGLLQTGISSSVKQRH